MAPRGSKKALSVEHEEFVASQYGGKRSNSSGGAAHDQGDVRVNHGGDATLIECKGQFGLRTSSKPTRSTLVSQMEKIADEAWSEGKEPAIALRYYIPESPLADNYGYVDLMVRLLKDDVARCDWLVGSDNT